MLKCMDTRLLNNENAGTYSTGRVKSTSVISDDVEALKISRIQLILWAVWQMENRWTERMALASIRSAWID